MLKLLIIFSIVSLALAFPTSSFAAKEFMKAGNSIQVKGGPSAFAFANADISCEGSKGTGSVASATAVKTKVTLEDCTSIFGEKEVKVNISTCNLEFTASETNDDAITLESGCKIEAEGCVIEPTENKELKEGGYGTLKEASEELESEFHADVNNLAYTANATCEKVAKIIKGNEGTFLFNAVVKGVAAQPVVKFKVEGATAGTPRVYEMDNTNTHVFKFGGTTNIECGEVKFTGETTTVINHPLLRFSALTFAKCTSNIVPPRQNVTLTATSGCYFGLAPYADNNVLRAGTGLSCEIRTEINATCKVMFFAGQEAGGVILTNIMGTQKEVEVKFSGNAFSVFQYRVAAATNACGGSIPRSGSATYTGTGKIKAKESGGGAATNIEVG